MKRNAYTPYEKAKIVLETLRGEQTVNEITSAHNIYPNMLSRWKREAKSKLYTLFQDDTAKKWKEVAYRNGWRGTSGFHAGKAVGVESQRPIL